MTAQALTDTKILVGANYSNITSKRPAYENVNPFRYGWLISANQNIQLKKVVNLNIGITYQEKMPLEFFEFKMATQAGTSSFLVFEEYPSNPQNRFYNEENFIRFPNFKYLNLEVVPNITLGNRIKTSFGVGLFGGVLLNKNEVTREQSDFVGFKDMFEQLGVEGNVEYTRLDFGWIPKIECNYSINDKIGIGIQLKSYYSFSRVNDTLIDVIRPFNLFWVSYAGGVSFQYNFNFNNKNRTLEKATANNSRNVHSR